jgi:hypothetical protein
MTFLIFKKLLKEQNNVMAKKMGTRRPEILGTGRE